MRGGSRPDGAGPPAVRGSLRSTGQLIIASRLLALQSRRILLSSYVKRLVATEDEEGLNEQARKLADGVATAERDYRKAVLQWASPETAQFWLISYQRMIEEAEDLAVHLRASAAELPGNDRAEVSADVIQLDQVINRWRKAMVTTMAAGGGERRLTERT